MRQKRLTKGQNGAKSPFGRHPHHKISRAWPKNMRGGRAPRRPPDARAPTRRQTGGRGGRREQGREPRGSPVAGETDIGNKHSTVVSFLSSTKTFRRHDRALPGHPRRGASDSFPANRCTIDDTLGAERKRRNVDDRDKGGPEVCPSFRPALPGHDASFSAPDRARRGPMSSFKVALAL